MRITIERNGAGHGGTRKPVYQQIAEQVNEAIVTGDLRHGDKLPTIRALAEELGVNRDTVALAYDGLARDGIVETTVGRGTFVHQTAAGRPPMEQVAPPLSPVVDRLLDFERARPEFAARDGAVPLHSLTPDPSLYPLKAFRRSLNRVLDEGGTELLVYGGHQGNGALRNVIAARLRVQGVDTSAEQLVLCQGASQGMSLALRLYAEPGDWVAVEEPTYHNVLGVLVGLGLRAAPVPMSEDGPDLDVLERTLARPEVKLFYTMPSFHNPLGTTTGISHRRALLDVAARAGKPIIEDGFEMDLRYDGRDVPPLAALDMSGVVVHLFSFSKSLFPGVRIGSICARGRAVDGLLALKYTTDLSGVLVLQAAVADFVQRGGYDRHLNNLRGRLRQRRDVLLAALAKHMPEGTRWTRPDGGYQIWVDLPGDIDSRALLREAQTAGVMFAPGHQFHHDGRLSTGLRLTTALADSSEIRRGIEILGRLVRTQLAARTPRVARDTSIHV
ncbi:MAG: GntR family transcriptional regulator MpaR [Gammaproteobacteria bacterium]|nr:MAG: GntR family transcriptional regulator MpaR [Gammaproteobacteria bacterium]